MVPLYPPFRCYDAIVCSTVRIDDDLMVELKRRAHDAGISLTRMLNRTLRVGLASPERLRGDARPYKQRTVTMGRPLADLDKALALAADLEDEEAARKTGEPRARVS